ncbi:hypothetical protein LguiA_029824 [Lonicera macranthoides]
MALETYSATLGAVIATLGKLPVFSASELQPVFVPLLCTVGEIFSSTTNEASSTSCNSDTPTELHLSTGAPFWLLLIAFDIGYESQIFPALSST